MKIHIIFLLFELFVLGYCAKPIFRQCPNGKSVDNLQAKVAISNCTRVPCKLKKKTTVEIDIKLKPLEDTPKLTNTVHANIVGIPFPFIGVDGTDACDHVYDSEGKTKVGCPLKSGQEYLYRNVIDVLEIYPNIKTTVHWALTGDRGDIMCFEVPARIIN